MDIGYNLKKYRLPLLGGRKGEIKRIKQSKNKKMKEQTNEMTAEQLEDIKRIKVFSILEYLEQQIAFIAENYKDIFVAYQSSKENRTKIEQYEESAK